MGSSCSGGPDCRRVVEEVSSGGVIRAIKYVRVEKEKNSLGATLPLLGSERNTHFNKIKCIRSKNSTIKYNYAMAQRDRVQGWGK